MTSVRWEEDAENALNTIPVFVREKVRLKIEEAVLEKNSSTVTLADFNKARDGFLKGGQSKPPAEIASKMPQQNLPGVEMVEINACHSKFSGCPNPLIETDELKQAIAELVKEEDYSEKLRQRVHGDSILHHQKFHISISGCPNGCSRPQIADIGITGRVRPEVIPEECTACCACEEVCPDKAITVDGGPPVFNRKECQGCIKCRDICPNGCIKLSSPGYRIMVAGKLGRHPHLAEVIGEDLDLSNVVSMIDKLLEEFTDNALPDERFADYWIRKKI